MFFLHEIFFIFLDGSWNVNSPKLIKLGVLPVRSLLVMEGTIWAASGGQIFIIDRETYNSEVGINTKFNNDS